jgi:SAM-dependent methyltransferase
MPLPDRDPSVESARRRAEWAERLDYYARDAAPRTRPYAEALVALLPPPSAGRVLDVATGTGLVAVEAARRAGPDGSVLATDFLPGWEPHVRETAARAGLTNVDFAVMPAEALALEDESFDTVYCQLGLMFMPEPVRALREMRRVLRPGGRLGVVVWSVPEKVGLFLVSRIVAPALPPPEEPPPSPMSLGEPGLVERLVRQAGFRDVAVHHITRSHEVADPEAEWQAWSATPAGAGLAALPPPERQRLRDDVITALEGFRRDDGIQIPSEAIVVTAAR